jgi:ATP-dependent Clp protease ATP-binding subunit ClpC
VAQDEAKRLHSRSVGTEHLLLGLTGEGEGKAGQALRSLGLSLEDLRVKVAELLPSEDSLIDAPPFSQKAKEVLDLALREALQLGHSYIGTEHILLGLVRKGDSDSETLLVSLGANLGRVRQEVVQLMSGHRPSTPVPSDAPWCPHCHGALTEFARYRTLSIWSETHESDEHSLKIDVVYCAKCGVSLDMFT